MPFYQFNHFTGRLKESGHLQPLYPISPKPLHNYDSPKMIWDSVKTKVATVEPVRHASGGSSGGGTLPPKMLKTMAEFQKNLDTPVYIIRGTPDKILFGISCALTAVGLGMCLEFIIRRAQPPKN